MAARTLCGRSDTFGTKEVLEMSAPACENAFMGRSGFWHPPVWKWIVFLVLIAGSAFLFFHKPPVRPVKVEILPFTDSPPAWDGSYPYLSTALVDVGTGHVSFKTSISRIQPTVRHDSPVNVFQGLLYGDGKSDPPAFRVNPGGRKRALATA